MLRKHYWATQSDLNADLDAFVSEQNIALYRKLLDARTDADQRQTIARMLREEIAKLRARCSTGDKPAGAPQKSDPG